MALPEVQAGLEWILAMDGPSFEKSMIIDEPAMCRGQVTGPSAFGSPCRAKLTQ